MITSQFQTGQLLQSVFRLLCPDGTAKHPSVAGLLQHLCTFDVSFESSLDIASPICQSPLVVFHNQLVRGLPTLCSAFVEERLNDVYGFCTLNSLVGKWEYVIPHDQEEMLFKDVCAAMHIVDPRIERTYVQFDSGLEAEFYNQPLFDTCRFLRQILHPQRYLSEMIDDPRRFKKQRVDFSFLIPYHSSRNVELYDERRQIFVSKGFVFEIDGDDFHQLEQIPLDKARDAALVQNCWEVLRINSKTLNRDSQKAFNKLQKTRYVEIVRENFERGLKQEYHQKILEWTLIPLAISRVQYAITLLLINEKISHSSKIAFVERDVPCCHLAMEDMRHWMQNFLGLGEFPFDFCDFDYRVFSSEEFINSPLHPNGVMPSSSLDPEQFDLVFDISILNRSGWEQSYPWQTNVIFVRSSHFTKPCTRRRFLSSEPIVFNEVARLKGGEEYEFDEKQVARLNYFLKNLFRKERFRDGQIPILNRALLYKSVIGLLPTGGGKSLTYQLATLLQPGVSLVVNPIKSLMVDQYDNLRKRASTDVVSLTLRYLQSIANSR